MRVTALVEQLLYIVAQLPQSQNLVVINRLDTLQLGVQLDANLDTSQERLYRIDVPAGATLRVDLNSTANTAANEMFIRYNDVPTPAVFDAAYTGPLAPNQTVTIPTTSPCSSKSGPPEFPGFTAASNWIVFVMVTVLSLDLKSRCSPEITPWESE